jgi:hypothetical protein
LTLFHLGGGTHPAYPDHGQGYRLFCKEDCGMMIVFGRFVGGAEIAAV